MLLRGAQLEHTAALDRGRVDTNVVGDQVMLLTKKLLDVAEVGKLVRPLWEGPFPVAAQGLPARFKCSPMVHVNQ